MRLKKAEIYINVYLLTYLIEPSQIDGYTRNFKIPNPKCRPSWISVKIDIQLKTVNIYSQNQFKQ